MVDEPCENIHRTLVVGRLIFVGLESNFEEQAVQMVRQALGGTCGEGLRETVRFQERVFPRGLLHTLLEHHHGEIFHQVAETPLLKIGQTHDGPLCSRGGHEQIPLAKVAVD